MVELSFDMEPQVVHANRAVADDRGRVALQRGPIVYCMEHLDQNEQKTSGPEDFARYAARLSTATTVQYRPDLLDGVVVLEHPGAWLPAEGGPLYQSAPAPGKGHPPDHSSPHPLLRLVEPRDLRHAGLDSVPRSLTLAALIP